MYINERVYLTLVSCYAVLNNNNINSSQFTHYNTKYCFIIIINLVLVSFHLLLLLYKNCMYPFFFEGCFFFSLCFGLELTFSITSPKLESAWLCFSNNRHALLFFLYHENSLIFTCYHEFSHASIKFLTLA